MPWLTDLADVVRDAGLTADEQPNWKTRGRGPMGAVQGVICHHTVGPAKGNYPSLRVVRDGRADLPGPLSQLGLARDGTVMIIAAGVANHAGAPDRPRPPMTGNTTLIGIEAESIGVRRPDGTWDWTTEQLDAYPRLVHALAAHYRFPTDRILGHREWAPSRKIDPAGIDMDDLRNPSQEDDMGVSPSFEPDVRGDLAAKQKQLNGLEARFNLLDKDLRGDLATKGKQITDLRTALEEIRGDVRALVLALSRG